VLRITPGLARGLSRGYWLAAIVVKAAMPSVVVLFLFPLAPDGEVDNAEMAASPSPNAGVRATPPTPVGTPPEQPAPRKTPTAKPGLSTASWRQTPHRHTSASATGSPSCPQCGSRRWS